METLFRAILHIDTYLIAFVNTYGIWTYAALFAVIFCETGFVITPFLPGDSLLFAAGSLAATANQGLHIQVLFLLLIAASILGNKINYLMGRAIGPRVFSAKQSWFFNKKYLEETKQFYEKHGGKTIILARFMPIIRTFAPFVAGIGTMNLRTFSFYNIFSAILWVGTLLGAGYFLGSLDFVKTHFSIIVYAIVVISVLPAIVVALYRKVVISA